jgi:hypothetical protein
VITVPGNEGKELAPGTLNATIGTVSAHVIRRYFPAEACQFTRTLMEERSG